MHKSWQTQMVYTCTTRQLFGLLGLCFHVPLGHRIGSYWLSRFGGFQGRLSPQVLGLGQLSILLHNSSIGVQLEHCPNVLQRVGSNHSARHFPVGSSQHSADSLRLQKSREVSVRHLRLRQVPACLGGRGFSPCSIKPIQLLEGRLGPDNKSANMASRSKLQDVEVVNLDGVNTWNISECLRDTLVLIVDNKRAELLHVAPVPQFSLASSHASALINLCHIGPSLVPPEEFHCLLGLGEPLCLVRHHKGHLRYVSDDVAFSHDKGRHTSGSDSRTHSIPFLGDPNLPVPAPPLLGGSEHPAAAAHVAKGCLARPVGASSPHPRDPRNGASSSPGLSTCLVSGGFADAVGLPPVLGNLVVDH